MEGHSSAISAIVELSDRRIVSASNDHTLRVWDPIRGVCVGEIRGHTKDVHALILLDDGRLASGDNDNLIIIWYLMG